MVALGDTCITGETTFTNHICPRRSRLTACSTVTAFGSQGSGKYSANDGNGECDAAGHCICTPTFWEHCCWWGVFLISVWCAAVVAAIVKAMVHCYGRGGKKQRQHAVVPAVCK